MKGENTMNDDVRILRTSTCPSLSGRSEVTYEFGHNEKAKSMLFRISDNTGNGHYSDVWIPLDAILKCLQEAKEPFSLHVFKSLYPGMSINNVGFLGAALQREGVIVCEKRQYLRKDIKTLSADLSKLTKKKTD